MTDIAWPIFIATSLAVIATPGQDMLIVMSRSIAQGPAAGLATAAGVSIGLLGHTLLATLGLGAILRASEWLFVALKFAGAAYLVWLGIGLLRTRHGVLAFEAPGRRAAGRLLVDGAVSNLTNPKIAIFYFAFLPQFVAAGVARPTLSVFVLGVAYALLALLVKGAVGLCAGTLSEWLRASPGALAWLHRTSGAILVGLGIGLAFERRH